MNRASKPPRIRGAVSLAGAITVCLVGACASVAPPPAASKAPPSTRMEHSAALRSVMRSFDRTARESLPGQIDAHDRWDGSLAEAAEAARLVQVSAAGLAAWPPQNLVPAEQEVFRARAEALGAEALVLEQAAARGDVDATEASRARLAEACRACHEGFRPGAPGVPAAFE